MKLQRQLHRRLFDLPISVLRTLRNSLCNSPQFRMPYLKVSLVFFIFQTRVFHNKLIQNPKEPKQNKRPEILNKMMQSNFSQ